VSATIPTAEPGRVVKGDTAKWLKTLPDYPASAGWVLTYTLANAAGRYTIAAAASGVDHLVTATATITAGWPAGDYALLGRVALGSEVYTVFEGRVTLAPDLAEAADTRSQARRALDAVDAMLEGRAASSVRSYEIQGRRLEHFPMADLLKLRDRLRVDVMHEDNAARVRAGLQPRGRVMVRFGA
jgi:hypothetical protein